MFIGSPPNLRLKFLTNPSPNFPQWRPTNPPLRNLPQAKNQGRSCVDLHPRITGDHNVLAGGAALHSPVANLLRLDAKDATPTHTICCDSHSHHLTGNRRTCQGSQNLQSEAHQTPPPARPN